MLVLIDNFDSFTYNIVHLFAEAGARVEVIRPDTLNLAQLADLKPDRIVIGPGPGHPRDADYSLQVIEQFYKKIPLLGICLGHQCLAHFFQAKVVRAREPMHGKLDTIAHDGLGVFKDLPLKFNVVRYHSLVVDPATLPQDLYVSAKTNQGETMALRHRHYPIEAVQFHPDSVRTEHGCKLIENFLR